MRSGLGEFYSHKLVRIYDDDVENMMIHQLSANADKCRKVMMKMTKLMKG